MFKNVNMAILLIFIFLSNSLFALTEKTTFMIPMRDSVHLAADIYFPSSTKGPWPVILVRTPYNRDLKDAEELIIPLLEIIFQGGYALAVQDSRGRYDSEGIDSLYFCDGWGKMQDGYDTIEWIAQQSWSNGKIGMWGASALGISQYLAAGAVPPHLTCCFAMVAAPNLYEDALFYNGVYRKSLIDGWIKEQGADQLLEYFIKHPHYDSGYDRINLATRYDSVNVPICHLGGWHDIFIQGQINGFENIQEVGGPMARGNQKLIIGPWVHDLTSNKIGQLSFPSASIYYFIDLMFQWLNYWLRDIDNGINKMPNVQYYLMGDGDLPEGPGNRWVQSAVWPPESDLVVFYIHENGILNLQQPSIDEPSDSYDYDPSYPVPTLGGRNMNIDNGSYDQREIESRSDVLVYTSEVLEDSLTIAGPITVTLYAVSDAIDTDFTAKICDVYPDGRSMLICDGIIRARYRNSITYEEFITPGEIYEYAIDLWSTAIVLAPGHSLRLSISSSNYPRFDKNLNTGNPFRQDTTIYKVAHQTIYHNTQYPSALNLPVIDGLSSKIQLAQTGQPESHVLGENFPNPFNNDTRITLNFQNCPIGNYETCDLEIFDLRGRRLYKWSFSSNKGEKITVHWNGHDRSGRILPSGIYLYRLTLSNHIETEKMTLLR